MKKNIAVSSHQDHEMLTLILSVCFLIGLAYLTALNAPFILDDFAAIRDNPRLGDPGEIFVRPLVLHFPKIPQDGFYTI